MSIIKNITKELENIVKQAGYEVENLVLQPSGRKDLGQYVLIVLGVVAFAAICMIVSDLVISKLLTTLDEAFPQGTTEETPVAILTALRAFFRL